MFRSVRWRIASTYILLFLVLIASLGYYLSIYFRETYLNSLENQLAIEARLVGDATLSYFHQEPQESQAPDELARHWAELIGARVTLILPSGIVIGESDEDRTLMDNHANRPEVVQALQEKIGSSIRFSHTVGYDMLYVAIPILENDQVIGISRVALPLKTIQSNIAHLRNTILLAGLAASIAAVLIATWLAQRITQPLSFLSQEAKRIAHGEQTDLFVPTPRDEIGHLSYSIQQMAHQQSTQIEALTRERSKLAAVLEQMTDGVVIVDSQSIIQLFNPAAARMFNTAEQTALGYSLAEVLRNHQLVEIWKRCRETNETQVITLDLVAPKISLQATAMPFGSDLPDNSILFLQDLTRLRQLETVRRDFISNISHELRTPLASLKALTETLLDGALDDPPAAQQFLQRIETEVDSLSLMVSELLELSRIESGKVPLHLKTVPPHIMFDEAVERLRLQAERNTLTLRQDYPHDLPRVLADPPRIEQVIVNLMHNAIKFTPAGGTIVLDANVQVTDGKPGFVVFIVRDNGVGIASNDLPRIFERFYKADRSRSGGGTGLGLAISKHLIEIHQGQIWAESIEGQGSSFYFTLPVA